MDYKGISVIIRNEYEFNRIKNFLGHENLFLDFVPEMEITETAIVIFADYESTFSTGSTGSSFFQKENGFRLINFNDFFK